LKGVSVAKGRHARRWGAIPVILVVVALLGLTGGGVTFAAYRYDRSHADQILPGVSVGGVDVGGMTRAQAVAAVRASTQTELSSSVSITAGESDWTATSKELGVHVDVQGAVDAALALNGGFGTLDRVMHRLRNEGLDEDIALQWHYGAAKVKVFLADIAGGLTTRPVNASIEPAGGDLHFIHSQAGRQLDTAAATTTIVDALRAGDASVRLKLSKIEPKVTDDTLGKTIVVELSTNTLHLYDGFKVERTYRVATAKAGYSTPVGVWTIVNKQENPTWYNPAPDTWGAGLPLSIPPGPGNPLGTRALYLNAPDIRIHGTYDSGSIGTYASHGCIRMNIADSEALYPLVPIGTRVIIK
jgi:lipoprotein-anchoring transpeptidase ErfK/SrfK